MSQWKLPEGILHTNKERLIIIKLGLLIRSLRWSLYRESCFYLTDITGLWWRCWGTGRITYCLSYCYTSNTLSSHSSEQISVVTVQWESLNVLCAAASSVLKFLGCLRSSPNCLDCRRVTSIGWIHRC